MSSTSGANSRTSAARSASTSSRRWCPRAPTPATTRDRQGGGHPARPHPRRRRDRPWAGSVPARLRAGRPGRADPLRSLAGEGDVRVQPHRGSAEGELRADHPALRVRRRRHRCAVRLPRPRPHHVRLPGGEPDRDGCAPEHGQVGLGLGVAANLAVRKNVPVALFTLEMSKSEVTQRLMCSEAKVESRSACRQAVRG